MKNCHKCSLIRKVIFAFILIFFSQKTFCQSIAVSKPNGKIIHLEKGVYLTVQYFLTDSSFSNTIDGKLFEIRPDSILIADAHKMNAIPLNKILSIQKEKYHSHFSGAFLLGFAVSHFVRDAYPSSLTTWQQIGIGTAFLTSILSINEIVKVALKRHRFYSLKKGNKFEFSPEINPVNVSSVNK